MTSMTMFACTNHLIYHFKKGKIVESLFDINGLMFWSEREIKLRNNFSDRYADGIKIALRKENKAWEMIQFEGPQLTPRSIINPNYTNDDIWVQEGDNLVLRPETTPSSYVFAKNILDQHNNYKAPLCVWQMGKSFRREQDQVTKNMRLKEFYQQEFQCIYSSDTLNDYHTAILEPVRKLIGETVCLPTRIVESDRLPSYSQITMDIEVNNGDKWMEVCSISRRTDFPSKLTFQAKNKIIEKDALVLEIAIGLDRCVYNYEQFAKNV